jgi:hypothetical protein
MVTVTTAWGGGDHAESSLLRAELNAALHGGAHVESVTINHTTGVVDVKVRLPAGLAAQERDRLRPWVQIKLASVITNAFEAEGLTLGRVVTV